MLQIKLQALRWEHTALLDKKFWVNMHALIRPGSEIPTYPGMDLQIIRNNVQYRN
jgi:hypothetical protein